MLSRLCWFSDLSKKDAEKFRESLVQWARKYSGKAIMMFDKKAINGSFSEKKLYKKLNNGIREMRLGTLTLKWSGLPNNMAMVYSIIDNGEVIYTLPESLDMAETIYYGF